MLLDVSIRHLIMLSRLNTGDNTLVLPPFSSFTLCRASCISWLIVHRRATRPCIHRCLTHLRAICRRVIRRRVNYPCVNCPCVNHCRVQRHRPAAIVLRHVSRRVQRLRTVQFRPRTGLLSRNSVFDSLMKHVR